MYDLVEGEDVWMAQEAEGLDLVGDPLQAVHVLDPLLVDGLDD